MKAIKILSAALLIISANAFAFAEGGPSAAASQEKVMVFVPVYKALQDCDLNYYVVKVRDVYYLIDEAGNTVRNLGDNFYTSDAAYLRPLVISKALIENNNQTVLATE